MRVARCKTAGILLHTAMLLLCFVPSGTQAERLPIKIYTTSDGLAHDHVKRIIRDSHGFLWFCTVNGLNRFDGYRFVTYRIEDGLPSPVVNDVLESRKGTIWIATDEGVCRFNPL